MVEAWRDEGHPITARHPIKCAFVPLEYKCILIEIEVREVGRSIRREYPFEHKLEILD